MLDTCPALGLTSGILYVNRLSRSTRWSFTHTGERGPRKRNPHVLENDFLSVIFRQKAGDIAKATVHLAHWLTVIINNTHCGVGTDVEAIASYKKQYRRLSTASCTFFVFIAARCRRTR